MVKTYLKIAFRNLLRKKLYGGINILGLALGLASSLVIGTWVYQQLSYDRHFENAHQIYRVGVNFFNVGDLAVGPAVFGSVVKEFPEVKAVTSIENPQLLKLQAENRAFEEDQAFAADSAFFDVFSFPFLQGDPAAALNQPNQVVLTEFLAEKLYGKKEVLGEDLLVGEDKISYTVVGVVKETHHRSHFNAKMWISLDHDPDRTSWTSANYYNYVLLHPGFTEASLTTRLDKLIKEQIYPSLNLNQPYEEWIESSAAYKFITTPLTDLYLKTNLRFDFFRSGNATNVYSFAAIALFIILLAGINYINISTARSSGRSKEVGVRKTLGSGRSLLVNQFLAESILISLFASILALGLGELFLKLFEQATHIHLLDTLFIGWSQILLFFLLSIVIGFAAGLYPAFYLSAFKPASMLKNQFSGIRKSSFRNVLVVTQFTISIGLMIATGIVYQQLQFLQNKDLGFNNENIFVIDNAGMLGLQQESFKQEVLALNGIEGASYNRRMPAGNSIWVNAFKTPEMVETMPFQVFYGDEEYLNTMGFHLLEGRNFSHELSSDTASVILNQSAVQKLGLQSPIGTILNNNLKVIGVVNDFNFESLHKKIEPAAIMLSKTGERMAIKVHHANIGEVLADLKDIWNHHKIAEPMSYYFLDQRFQQTLNNERSLGKAVTLFAVFAIIISCLGLFGLSAYICEQRTKEIGIRKVLGAASGTLVFLLNKNFTKLILFSIAAATPLSYIIMSKWLSNFAYKIEISPFMFIVAGTGALLIAWLTVSGQSIKTARMNPVKSLKNE